MAVWKINLNFLFRKKCVAIAILTLQLQLQLQLNSIERYIAIEIYFTNTRIFLIASLGSQLAQCLSARDPGSRLRQDYYYFPPAKSMPGSSMAVSKINLRATAWNVTPFGAICCTFFLGKNVLQL